MALRLPWNTEFGVAGIHDGHDEDINHDGDVMMMVMRIVIMMVMTMVLRRKTYDVKERDLIISPKNCSHWL